MRVSLTAAVARVYLELRGVQNDLRLARSNSEIAAKSLHVAERRRSQGVATGFDTSVARAQLASFEAAIPELEERGAAFGNALALPLAKPPRRSARPRPIFIRASASPAAWASRPCRFPTWATGVRASSPSARPCTCRFSKAGA